jgi:hypothetical protein
MALLNLHHLLSSILRKALIKDSRYFSHKSLIYQRSFSCNWGFIQFCRVTRNSWLFEKYGCLKSKSEKWCLLTTFSKILTKERKNHVCIRLFFSLSFIVLDRLNVFCHVFGLFVLTETLITNTINSFDQIVWIDWFD